jgi:hypothetical protein
MGVFELIAFERTKQLVYRSQMATPIAVPTYTRFRRSAIFSDKNMYFSTQHYGNMIANYIARLCPKKI